MPVKYMEDSKVNRGSFFYIGGLLLREIRSIYFDAEKTLQISNHIYSLEGREMERDMIKGGVALCLKRQIRVRSMK
jgi:hypothetical protein